jgi:putative ABC transport system substrate-binding protein
VNLRHGTLAEKQKCRGRKMRRRQFIAGLGSIVALPTVAPAQQPRLPVIGYLEPGSLGTRPDAKAAVHRGLSETGYVEAQNLTVEYRWAEDRFDRLPALADDLVRRQVRLIVAISTPAAVAAKAATQTIPIVFAVGADPVKIGLVASLNRPDSNLTGIYNLGTAVVAKRLELLHQLVPAAASIAYLINPTDRVFAEAQTREMQVAARALGLDLLIVNASEENEFEAAFATIVRERAGGLVVAGGALASSHVDCFGNSPPSAYNVRGSQTHSGRRPCELWNGLARHLAPSWGLCRAYSQGRKADRSSGGAGHKT